MNKDPFQIARSAITNGTHEPVSQFDNLTFLSTGDSRPGCQDGHLIQNLFQDCSLETLERMVMQCGLSSSGLRSAMRNAHEKHGTANADLIALGEDG